MVVAKAMAKGIRKSIKEKTKVMSILQGSRKERSEQVDQDGQREIGQRFQE